MARVLSGLNSAQRTAPRWARVNRGLSNFIASQMAAVLSSDAVTMHFASGLKLAEFTLSLCRKGGPIGSPVATSQTRAVPSSEALITFVAEALKRAVQTLSAWASGLVRGWPEAASQTRAV